MSKKLQKMEEKRAAEAYETVAFFGEKFIGRTQYEAGCFLVGKNITATKEKYAACDLVPRKMPIYKYRKELFALFSEESGQITAASLAEALALLGLPSGPSDVAKMLAFKSSILVCFNISIFERMFYE